VNDADILPETRPIFSRPPAWLNPEFRRTVRSIRASVELAIEFFEDGGAIAIAG